MGPVVTGVIGTQKFSFDVWGDTVNIASRMETTGVEGRIQVTASVVQRTSGLFSFERRGAIMVKGRGKMRTYFVRGLRADTATAPAEPREAPHAHDASDATLFVTI